jgi:hypothetical protein
MAVGCWRRISFSVAMRMRLTMTFQMHFLRLRLTVTTFLWTFGLFFPWCSKHEAMKFRYLISSWKYQLRESRYEQAVHLIVLIKLIKKGIDDIDVGPRIEDKVCGLEGQATHGCTPKCAD